MSDPIGTLTTDRYPARQSFLDRTERMRLDPEPLQFTERAMALGRDCLELLYAEASEFRESDFIDMDVRERMRNWLIDSSELDPILRRHLPEGVRWPTREEQEGLLDFVFAYYATQLVAIADDVVLRCVDLSEHPSGDPLPCYHRPTPLGLPEEAA